MQASRRERVLKTHLLRDKLSFENAEYLSACNRYFETQLEFDLPFNSEDVTSDTLVDADVHVRAEFVLKQDGIIAGTEEVIWFLKGQGGIEDVYSDCIDGEFVKKGRNCLFVAGNARVLLKLERVVLNLLQRMSGLATYAYDIAHDAAQLNPYILVCPTRKTFLGPLDKKAVMLAECGTHRVYLSDAILIKENHFRSSFLAFEQSLKKLTNASSSLSFIEIEVETPNQAVSAVKELADLKKLHNVRVPMGIMFDNFSPVQISESLQKIQEMKLYDNFFFEASGGITKENLSKYVNLGVDIISMGALTNSAPALDISMLVQKIQ